MNKYINSKASQHVMKLLMLGAKVQLVSGKMVYVKFCLENDIEVSYVYHINKKNKFFLDRIKPYPLPLKEYDSAKEVIDAIQVDYDQYKNAVKSRNIRKFVNVNIEMHNLMKNFEDLFLYYNISPEQLETINQTIEKAKKTILEASKSHDRVYFEKEPEHLK